MEEQTFIKDTEAVEVAPQQDPLARPLPAIEDSSSSAAEFEAKEPKPVALPQTPPQKLSTTTSNPTTPLTSPVTSPWTASLGRSTDSPTRKSPDEKVAPRSSLGDLKIPSRISRALAGLRRDLGIVREFTHSVEQPKELQATYRHLVVEIQKLFDGHTHLHAT